MRLTLIAALVASLAAHAQDNYRAEREAMVLRQIERRGISDPDVLRAMRETPRHEFVPEDVRRYAYLDQALPIGYNQTISQPYIVAFMTENLAVEKTHKVLEIGTGSGYQAAVLAPLVKHLYTIEIVPELAESARQKLSRYDNVTTRLGDGYRGWPDQAPFDRIILTAAPPEIPQELISQLAQGGKLLAPEGSSVWGQELVLVEKDVGGKLTRRAILPVRFVPMVRGEDR